MVSNAKPGFVIIRHDDGQQTLHLQKVLGGKSFPLNLPKICAWQCFVVWSNDLKPDFVEKSSTTNFPLVLQAIRRPTEISLYCIYLDEEEN